MNLGSEFDLTDFIAEVESEITMMARDLDAADVYTRCDSVVDLVLGSHLSRLFATAKNVLMLAHLGEFQDAATLCRSMIEHLVSLNYITSRPDVVKAASDFVIDGYTHGTERFKSMEKHYPDIFSPSEADRQRREEVKAFVDGLGYGGKFQLQIAALDRFIQETVHGDQQFAFLNEFIYADFSQFVHPRSGGLGLFAQKCCTPFRLQKPKSDATTTMAVYMAYLCCSCASSGIREVWGLTIQDPLPKFEVIVDKHRLRDSSNKHFTVHFPKLNSAPIPSTKSIKPRNSKSTKMKRI